MVIFSHSKPPILAHLDLNINQLTISLVAALAFKSSIGAYRAFVRTLKPGLNPLKNENDSPPIDEKKKTPGDDQIMAAVQRGDEVPRDRRPKRNYHNIIEPRRDNARLRQAFQNGNLIAVRVTSRNNVSGGFRVGHSAVSTF